MRNRREMGREVETSLRRAKIGFRHPSRPDPPWPDINIAGRLYNVSVFLAKTMGSDEGRNIQGIDVMHGNGGAFRATLSRSPWDRSSGDLELGGVQCSSMDREHHRDGVR